jgi:hypothetical protein
MLSSLPPLFDSTECPPTYRQSESFALDIFEQVNMADIYILDFSAYGTPSHTPEVFVNLLPPPKISFHEAEMQRKVTQSEIAASEFEDHDSTSDRSSSCCNQLDPDFNINMLSTVFPLASSTLREPPELPDFSLRPSRSASHVLDSKDSRASLPRRRRISSQRRISNLQQQISPIALDIRNSNDFTAAEDMPAHDVTFTPQTPYPTTWEMQVSRIQLSDKEINSRTPTQLRSRSM